MDKKTAIITGGGSGIGFACLEKFISHNYRVIIIDYRIEGIKEKLSSAGISKEDIDIHQANVADFNELENVFTSIHGVGSTVLINCAGISPSTCLLYTSPSPRDLSTSRMPSSA